MWAESQNGEWLVNLNRTNVLSVFDRRVYADDTILGEYATKEQAKRALKYLKDEIAEHGCSAEYLCRMPKEMKEEG